MSTIVLSTVVQMRVLGCGEVAGSCFYLMTFACACVTLVLFTHLHQSCVVTSAAAESTVSSAEAHSALRE